MRPAAAGRKLKAYAAAKPGAWEDHPWGETVFKAGKKIFVFFSQADAGLALTCKLPDSAEAAITLFSFAEPTGYGLGKSGWVTARFSPGEDVPVDLFKLWIDESYAAIAPRRRSPAPARKRRTPARGAR